LADWRSRPLEPPAETEAEKAAPAVPGSGTTAPRVEGGAKAPVRG